MKVTVQPFGTFNPSVKRNNKGGITFVDTAGHPIKGNINRHYMSVYDKQKQRFDTKFEAFSLLTKEELQSLFINPTKDKVKGSTDRLAVAQAYYNVVYKEYEEQSLEQLRTINLDELDEVLKKALTDNILRKEVEVIKQEETINQ